MAIELNGSSQYLWYNGAIVNAPVFSVAAWIKPSNNNSSSTIFAVSDASTIKDYFLHNYQGDDDDTVRMYAAGATSSYAYTSSSISDTNWHHTIGIIESTTSRYAYLDGGSEGSNTGTQSPNSTKIDVSSIGAMICSLGSVFYFPGSIAEIALWSAVLTSASRAYLADGVYPNQVQSGDLIAYWPLYDDPYDDVASYDMTEVGSPSYGTHPTMQDMPAAGFPPGSLSLLGVGI